MPEFYMAELTERANLPQNAAITVRISRKTH